MASPDETRSDAPPTPEPRPPSVDRLARAIADVDLPHPLLVDAARSAVASGNPATAEQRARNIAGTQARSLLTSVVNATGVLLHTNMGRSPWMNLPGNGSDRYSSLELDLDSGERGSRQDRAPRLLARMCGAESAMVVNNCAAGVLLALAALADGRGVVVSRGELVEIGGGFRIPEVLESSGARLVEVGATNKTHLKDYAGALTERTALILKVHRSNFYLEGFTAEPAPSELAALAREHGIPLVEDLGSGAVMNTDDLAPIDHEPTPQEVLRNGIDLVIFSGDKLLGGPQAGIIAGCSALVARVKGEPFFRAVRCDKLILTVLQECIDDYLRSRGEERPDIPVLNFLALPLDDLQSRAEAVVTELDGLPVRTAIVETTSQTGGGTMPRAGFPSLALEITPTGMGLEKLAGRLRSADPAVIGYVHEDKFLLNLRTVFPSQDKALANALRKALQ